MCYVLDKVEARGMFLGMAGLVRDHLISLPEAARRSNMSVEEFTEKMKEVYPAQ